MADTAEHAFHCEGGVLCVRNVWQIHDTTTRHAALLSDELPNNTNPIHLGIAVLEKHRSFAYLLRSMNEVFDDQNPIATVTARNR